MNKALLTLATIGFMAGSVAWAQTPIDSEFFFQTDAQVNMVRPQFEFSSTSFDFENMGDREQTTSELSLTYERGLNENYAAGIELGYTAGEYEEGGTQVDRRGLNDVSVYAKGRKAWQSNSTLYYGVALGVSPGDQELDVDEQDANTGGNNLVPYVGYQWLMGSNVLGVRAVTEIGLGDRTVVDQGNEVLESGSDETAANVFYEIPYDEAKGRLGLAAGYIYTSSLERDGTVAFDGYNSMGFSVYSPYRITQEATVVGSVNYTNVLTDNISGVNLESGGNLAVNLAGRFYF